MIIIESNLESNIEREKRMNEKTARTHFIYIVYLLYVAGFGVGLAVGSTIGSMLCLIGISIALLGFVLSYILSTRILKGGHKVDIVDESRI